MARLNRVVISGEYYSIFGGFIELLSGNEIVLKAALAAGADAFFGYPITPTTEILQGWAREAKKNKELIFLQTEDEPAAGFGVIGAALGGKKSWTTTAGVGHILLQDAVVLAEAMRIPFVAYIGQRGGPSTGTVIYSQQELSIARDGGNGEGFRIVLGASNLQELYDLTILAFDIAWRYRLPVFVLGDGYLSKTIGEVDLGKKLKVTKAEPIIQNGKRVMNLRNCYSLESELAQVIKRELKDYSEIAKNVELSEVVRCSDAEIVVFAWGTVGSAAREAVDTLRKEGHKVGLFRPITLKPFGAKRAKQATRNAKKILIVESAFGKFGRLVTESLFGVEGLQVERLYKPVEGIYPEEIKAKLRSMIDGA
jgi:2-oxoglutarate/2-oxoacid ferredoxin oxidoreductase subunit alpha